MQKTGSSRLRLLGDRFALIAAYGLLISLPLMAARPFAGPRHPAALTADAILLLAFPVIALQPVLAARLKVLDRRFGLDNIYIFHKIMGTAAGTLLFCEPFFRVAGGAAHRPGLMAPGLQYLHLLGILAAVLILALVTTALLYDKLGLSFEGWRRVHNILALSILALVFTIGFAYRLLPGAGAKWLWILLLVLAGAAYGYHKIVGPFHRRRHAYAVHAVIRETRNVWTLRLKPPAGGYHPAFLPGQFQFLTFYRGRNLPVEEHPFTISSSPAEKGFHGSTIKNSGDFTRTMEMTRKGDLVAVQAPFGRFSHLLHPEEKELVFLAAGIGITPFMSMLRHMRDTGADHRVVLLYGNSTEEDIVFRGELEAIASGERPRLRLIHVLSRPGSGWRGERGHVSRETIEKHIPDRADRSFYLCGPPAMMTQLRIALTDMGVPAARIRSERFAL